MDPTPQQITAMAEELSALAKRLECAKDPGAIKHTKEALVIKAKNLIGQVQGPLDVVMDHISQVGLSQLGKSDANLHPGLPRLRHSCIDGNRHVRSNTGGRRHERCRDS